MRQLTKKKRGATDPTHPTEATMQHQPCSNVSNVYRSGEAMRAERLSLLLAEWIDALRTDNAAR